MNTIINKEEVLQLSELDTGFLDAASIRNIALVEIFLEKHCLGDLYASLKDDMVSYSGVSGYDSATTYTAGEIVLYKGQYRKATKSTTLEPNHDFAWENAPKFTDDAYNDLWLNRGLGQLFAYAVIVECVPTIKTKLRNSGLVKLQSGAEIPADMPSADDFEDYIRNVASRWVQAFKVQLEASGLAGSLSIPLLSSTSCDGSCVVDAGLNLTGLECFFYGQYENGSVQQCSKCSKGYETGQYGVY